MSRELYVEKYRPKTLSEAVLPAHITEYAEQIIASGFIPNLFLYGKAGTGKTSLAKLLCDVLGYDLLYINASNEGRQLDTVRTTITDFAVGTSLTGNKKVVILDEFCGCTPVVQDALKAFFEEYSSTCTWVIIANNKHKINAPILSRFSQVEFKVDKAEMQPMAVKFLKRLEYICQQESVAYDKLALVQLIKTHFPDFRKVINEFQLFSMNGTFNMESIKTMETPVNKIIECLKTKNFRELRKIVATTNNINIQQINKDIYDIVDDIVEPKSIPDLITIMNRFDYTAQFCQDQELNIMAEMIHIMSDVEFK